MPKIEWKLKNSQICDDCPFIDRKALEYLCPILKVKIERYSSFALKGTFYRPLKCREKYGD